MSKVVLPFVRSPYNYDRDLASTESGLECRDVSLAKQSFAEECDINTIVRRFGLSGQLPENLKAPTYADFSDVVDFHSAMNAVRVASESFMAMPAEVRSRFDNDAGKFVDFCSDFANRDEAIRLGLIDLPGKDGVIIPGPVKDPGVDVGTPAPSGIGPTPVGKGPTPAAAAAAAGGAPKAPPGAAGAAQ